MKKVKFFVIVFIMLLPFHYQLNAASNDDDWLHASGNRIMERHDLVVRITGINWFGYDTSLCVFHGLWSRDLEEMLLQIADLGFNTIRIPLHAVLVDQWRRGISVTTEGISIIKEGDIIINEYLEGLDTLGILDYMVNYCNTIGLKVILDMHSIEADDYKDELWFTDTFPLRMLIDAWKFLVSHYRDTDVLIGVDLKNEPHGLIITQGDAAAKWDDSRDDNNWKNGAEIIAREILSVNPNLLIFIEGVQQYYDDTIPSFFEKLGLEIPLTEDPAVHNGWWGGNLMGVRNHPADLGPSQDKVVYAPHEYGPNVHVHPWFYNGFNRDSMQIIWEHFWLFVHQQNMAPVLIGEWGGHIEGNDPDTPWNKIWMTALRDLITEENLNHIFWCWNENSHDTGGIITGSQWESIDTAKYQFIRRTLWQDESALFISLDHEAGLGTNGVSVSDIIVPNSTEPPTPVPSVIQPSNPPPADKLGDVNGDGVADIIDALMVAQYYIGLNVPGFNTVVADVNFDGNINIVDSLMIAQAYVGLIELEYTEPV